MNNDEIVEEAKSVLAGKKEMIHFDGKDMELDELISELNKSKRLLDPINKKNKYKICLFWDKIKKQYLLTIKKGIFYLSDSKTSWCPFYTFQRCAQIYSIQSLNFEINEIVQRKEKKVKLFI